MASLKARLGERYRDVNTGFEGVAICRSEWQYGCVRVTLQALVEGQPREHTFDEPGLEEAAASGRRLRAGRAGDRPDVPRSGS